MYNGDLVGSEYGQIKWRIEKELKNNLSNVKKELLNESIKYDNIDEKVVAVVTKSLEKVLPDIVAKAVNFSSQEATQVIRKAFNAG